MCGALSPPARALGERRTLSLHSSNTGRRPSAVPAPVRTLTYIVRRAGSSPIPFPNKVIGNDCRATSRRCRALRYLRRQCRARPRPAPGACRGGPDSRQHEDLHRRRFASVCRGDGRSGRSRGLRRLDARSASPARTVDAGAGSRRPGRDPRHGRRARPPVRARHVPARHRPHGHSLVRRDRRAESADARRTCRPAAG